MSENSEYRQLCVLVVFGSLTLYGREKGTLKILRALKDIGINVHFIISKEWGYLVKPKLIRDGFSYSTANFGVTLGRILFYWPLNILFVLKAILLFPAEIARKTFDFRPTHILFGNWGEFLYAFPALVFLKTTVIYRLGDNIPTGIYGILFRRLIAPRVKRFICISEYIKRKALANSISEDKLKVIYNFPPLLQEGLQSTHFIYRHDPNQIIITYVGQMHIYKGVHLFVQVAIDYALERPDVKFYLAGDYTYENPFAMAQIKKVKEQGLEARIIFLGYIEDPEYLLRESDIHCAPSLGGEALGNVVLEAKACGVPSVVFPDGGLPEMIEHGVDGYICRDKTLPALKEGISFFLNSKDTLDNAKIKAVESLNRFDRGVLADKWIKVLRETIR